MSDYHVERKATQLGTTTYGVFLRAKRAYGLDRVNVAEDYKKWQDFGLRPDYVNQFVGRL